MKNRSILWYRQDLRLHDNEALYEALRWNSEVIPVYVFDPRVFFATSIYGNRRMQSRRAKFIIDAVYNLRKSWQEIGSDLVVRMGHPEDIVFELAKDYKTDVVFCNRERTRDEVAIQDKLEQNLWTIGQEMRFTRGKMLYYTQDLPFPVTHTPNNFSTFRKELDRIVPVRQILPYPDSVSPILQSFDPGGIPTLADLQYEDPDPFQIGSFTGGEDQGLKKLKEYVWSPEGLEKYRTKEKFFSSPMFSSGLSPWLAQGCISPKMVYHEIKSFESIHGSNDNTQSMIDELMRRDYCRLIAKKYGEKIFEPGGVLGKMTDHHNKDEAYLFKIWKESRTGVPVIDAAMKSLSATGYIAYPLRVAVALYLIHVLKVHWRIGADWFEANLIDYDVATNWVQWMIIAGLLPEAQEEKFMSNDYLCKKYDPQGDFIKKWIPALKEIPANKIFHPELLSAEEQKQYNVILGKEYPRPVV